MTNDTNRFAHRFMLRKFNNPATTILADKYGLWSVYDKETRRWVVAGSYSACHDFLTTLDTNIVYA